MNDGDESENISRRLSCPDPSVLPKPDDVNTDVGAGANAGSSKGGIMFAAVDTLSELVWSPRNGLSLRCTGCSSTGKRKLLSPASGVELSNMVIPQRSRSNEAGFHVNFELRTRDILDRTEAGVNQDCWPSNEMDRPLSGSGGCMEDLNTVASMPFQTMVEKEDMLKCKVENKDDVERRPAETGEGNSRVMLDIPRAIGGKSGTLLGSETVRVKNALNRDPGMMTGAESREGLAIIAEKEDGDNTIQAGCMNISYLGNLESTAENNLPTLAGAANKTQAREDCNLDKGGCLLHEADAEKASPLRCPPTGSSSRRHHGVGKGKEKEKALSDGNIDGRTWKDDDKDESFGSVESCNSAGLFSRNKKRTNFEQQGIPASKRLKVQISEFPGSTSKLRQDSSFMNWISNMMKGFWKANEEDSSPTAALTITDINDHVNGIAGQHFALCCHKEDTEHRNTGFQSFFQSIYCPRREVHDADVDIPKEECNTYAAPLSCHGKRTNFQEQFLITNENVSSSGNDIRLVAELNVSSGKVAFSQANRALSSENKTSCYHESPADKEAKCSPSPRSKSKPNEEGPEPDGKEIQAYTNRNRALRSLWISRFSSRSSCLQSKDQHDRIASFDLKVQEANESASVMVEAHDSQKTAKESYIPALVSKRSDHDNSSLMHNLDPAVSSPRKELAEALAGLFARRLDAIKHIMRSDLAENAEGLVTLTCIYCGKKGHHLRDCPEVTDSELEDLVRGVNAQNGREKAAGLCIRCFQLNHWAATCPNAPQRNSGTTEGNKRKQPESVIPNAVVSTCGAKLSLHDTVDKQGKGVPEAIFDAIRVLRLSRTDILKWTNSKTNVSNLEGFFLRLRLGKWEEGLGGTGYYVACITGTGMMEKEESSGRRSEKSISVKVGGTTYLVESRFISNHDFLQEELKAWWRTTGVAVPSEIELSRKIRQRNMLGF